MLEFDEIIEEMGSFGPYQVRIFILVSLFETPAAWAMFLPVFTHAVPSWICYTNSSWQNPHLNQSVENTSLLTSNSSDNSSGWCDSDGTYCDDVHFTTLFTSITTDFNICGDSPIPFLITTLQMVGVLVGAGVTGQLADTFGRKKVFYSVYTLLLVAGMITSFMKFWQLYAVCRLFVGFFFGGTMVINFVLPLEFVGPRWRTFCGCIGFWAVGVMTLAPMAYFIQNWRYLTMACSALGVPLLFTWWFVSESPRWLIQKGRLTEAEEILNQIADCNSKHRPDLTKLRTCATALENRRKERDKYSYWDLFRNCNMSKNTLIIIYAWFVSSSVYYGTTLNSSNLSGNKYLNLFLSGLVELPALVFVVLVNNIIGRKKTLSLLMFVAGLSCFAILILDLTGADTSHNWLVTTFALLGKSGIAGAWASAQVFSAETFPTVVRNIGIGASSMSARIGGIVAPQIVSLNIISVPLPFTIFGCLALLCAILSCLLPETLNQPLPDTLPPRECGLCCHKKDLKILGDFEEMQVIKSDNVTRTGEDKVKGSRTEKAVNELTVMNGKYCDKRTSAHCTSDSV